MLNMYSEVSLDRGMVMQINKIIAGGAIGLEQQ